MNNGQPPYGDPSAWGQQGQQANPAQYPVQPNSYAQQGGYGTQQAYGQGYSQPMQPVQPYAAQSYTQPQTYRQQEHPQQQIYQQQRWQPYQQPYQQQTGPQPQQFYGQNQAPQQPYPQFNQMGQQMQTGYGGGYSGYYSQPQEKKFEIPFDVAAKVVLFGVLPVLFILAMIFSAVALKWIFLAGAVAGIVLMWMRDVVTPNMRLTMSLVLGVMAVVALVGALSGPPAEKDNSSGNVGNQVTQQNSGNTSQQQATDVPPAEATGTPAPETESDGAEERLKSFFYFWSVSNDEAMLSLTAPSWRNSVENPAQALFVLLLNRIPQDDYEISNITGTDNDALRTATVKVTIDKNDGRTTLDRYAFKVILKKEDGIWYVDPKSLESNEKETATETAASANTTATQPPLYTGHPDTVLYYNPNGGTRYHLDPDCDEVGDRYKPMTSFLFAELDQSPYNELYACGPCGAPIPDD